MPKELVVLGIASLNYMVSFSYVNIVKSVYFAFFYDKAKLTSITYWSINNFIKLDILLIGNFDNLASIPSGSIEIINFISNGFKSNITNSKTISCFARTNDFQLSGKLNKPKDF